MKIQNTSQRLKQIMNERNLRQVDILNAAAPYCKKLNVKLGKNDLSQYVSGIVEPGQEKLTILGLTLGVSEAWLMGYDVPKERAGFENSLDSETTSDRSPTSYEVPVLGSIAAGIPIEAVEFIEDYEEIPKEWAANGSEYFGLKVKGSSMEPRMLEGDVVIFRKQVDVESGELAAVRVNGYDVTVKKLVKHSNGISLISFNAAYEPKFYTCEEVESLPVEVIGKVVELRGKF